MPGLLASLPKIRLLTPTDIPSELSVLAWGQSAFASAEKHKVFASRATTASEASEEIDKFLDHFPVPDDFVAFDAGRPDDIAHDRYFHVSRVLGFSPAVFARMIFEARSRLLCDVVETPINIPLAMLDQIDQAFVELSAETCAGNAPVGPVTHWATRGGVVTPEQAMTRWVRGHQIFAALSQGLIFSFQALRRAIKTNDTDAIQRWSNLSISLLQGSGAAFVFTGDFSMEVYVSHVRQTMMEPDSPINLSGLMSFDHRFMMQTIRDMRPTLHALHEQLPELHARIQEELGIVYDRHIHVCERFVGKSPSLRTAKCAKKSGPELLESFKALRMGSFDVPAHSTSNHKLCPIAHATNAGDDLSPAFPSTSEMRPVTS